MSTLLFLALSGCYENSMMSAYTSDYGEDTLPEEDSAADTADSGECAAEEPVTLYLSPDDSNSMSSPVQARDLILDSPRRASGVPVRTYEFMNYYSFDYPAADEGSLHVEAAMRATDEPGTYELQIGVSAPYRATRAPMNLTFSVDSSGSMGGEPLHLVKALGAVIAGQLQEGDVVSMVTWSDNQQVVLESHRVTGPNDLDVLGAFSELDSDGSTNLTAGLAKAYELAEANYQPGRINRVVLVSDGGANVGVTDSDLIAEKAGDEDDIGIYMVGVGVGTPASYSDQLMDAVTDAGKGAALFIPDEDEAARMFGPRFLETFDVAARSVQLELTLPPGFEIVKFSGEEYSTDPREIEPQNLAPNDAMVFYQTIRTCAPEGVTADSPVDVQVRWLDPISFEPATIDASWTFGGLLAAEDPRLAKGRAVYAYAELLKGYDDEGSSDARAAFDVIFAEAQAANPGDADLAEIAGVVAQLR